MKKELPKKHSIDFKLLQAALFPDQENEGEQDDRIDYSAVCNLIAKGG